MLELLTLEAPVGNVVTLHDLTAPGGVNALGAAIVEADGLVGVPPVREDSRERTEQHGDQDDSRFVGARGPSITGELWGATIGAAYQRHDDLVRALWATLEAPGILRYRRQGVAQPTLRALVKSRSYDCPLAGAAKLLTYTLALGQGDPRAYDDALVTVVGAPLSAIGGGLTFPLTFPLMFASSGGGTVEVENPGSAPTPLVMRAHGRIVAPRVRVLETGEEIVLTGEIGEGFYYEIDTGGPSIRLNGETERMNQLDPAASTFFELPARSTRTLQLLGAEFDAGAVLDVDVRAAFGG